MSWLGVKMARDPTVSLIPFEGRRSRDVTVVCSKAVLYIDLAVQGPSCVMMAASCKEAKYLTLQTQYDFKPITSQALGPINESATSSVYDFGWRISLVSGEDGQCQFQCNLDMVQHFNMVFLHSGLCRPTTHISICYGL